MKILKKTLLCFLGFAAFFQPLQAQSTKATPFGWGQLACVWGCSFNACKNVEVLRRCASNCDAAYITKCMHVAKSAFGEVLLPQVLKPLPIAEPQTQQPSRLTALKAIDSVELKSQASPSTSPDDDEDEDEDDDDAHNF